MHIHKWNLNDLENMIPWEKEIYVEQLRQLIEEQNEEARSRK